MASNWYPAKLSALIPWHATFKVECNNYSATLSSVLTAGVLTQVNANMTMIANSINYLDDAHNFQQDVVAYVKIVTSAPHGTALPAAIEDYTRRLGELPVA